MYSAPILFNLIASIMLAGIIWFVQLVQFPLFQQVKPAHFLRYEISFKQSSSWFLLVFFLLEAYGTIGVLAIHRAEHPLLVWSNLILFAFVWITTIGITTPIHTSLMQRYLPEKIRLLHSANWLRTVGWTLKAAVAVLLFIKISSAL